MKKGMNIENNGTKRIKIFVRYLILILLTAISATAIYLLQGENSFLGDANQVVNLIFVLFGFVLTGYIFVSAVLDALLIKHISDANKENIEKITGAYLKELKENILIIFVAGLWCLLINLLANAKFMPALGKEIFSCLFYVGFTLSVILVLDTILSIFKVIEANSGRKQG